MELRNHRDDATDVSVELGQVLSRYPVFQMRCPAHLLWCEARQIGRVDFELRDEPSIATACVLGVPLARNLFSVFAAQDGVEDGLLRQARRKFPEAATFDEFEFLPADWPIERRGHRRGQAPVLPSRPSNTEISGEGLHRSEWTSSASSRCSTARSSIRLFIRPSCEAPDQKSEENGPDEDCTPQKMTPPVLACIRGPQRRMNERVERVHPEPPVFIWRCSPSTLDLVNQ